MLFRFYNYIRKKFHTLLSSSSGLSFISLNGATIIATGVAMEFRNLDFLQFSSKYLNNYVFFRCLLVERGGSPAAASPQPQHGAGDPAEPAARESTGQPVGRMRRTRLHLGDVAQEPPVR